MAENLRGVQKLPHFAVVAVDTNMTEVQLPDNARFFHGRK